jgi:hypothetical protein
MQDACTSRSRSLRVSRGFETSRLEKRLLADAYEHAVPILSARPRTKLVSHGAGPTPAEMDLQPPLAKERNVG